MGGGPDKTVYLSAAQTLVETVARPGLGAPKMVHRGGGGSLLNAVASWEEHLCQHTDRLTGFDEVSDPPERSSHLLSVEVAD